MPAQRKDAARLIEVYRALAEATQEPSRRVALLFDLARIDEESARRGAVEQGPDSPIARALSYLHAAYEVGVDQLRVVDEILRVTTAHGRSAEQLAALDVKADLLRQRVKAMRANPKRSTTLFADAPETNVEFALPK